MGVLPAPHLRILKKKVSQFSRNLYDNTLLAITKIKWWAG